MVQKSALLTKYLDLYNKKPTSRVFAPLAETYRKLGMYDEALSVLKNGIRHNSTYPLGYIILGNCYYDLEKYDHAYEVVRPFVKTNLDNISLQKLFAQICEKINRPEEALETYKYLLFVNPKDELVAAKVEIVEREISSAISVDLTTEAQEVFDTEENWVQVSFVEQVKEDEDITNQEDAWAMEKAPIINEEISTEDKIKKFKEELEQEVDLDEPNLDDEYYLQDFDNDEEEVLEEEIPEKPIITHTLVDLYLKQSHFDKAIEFLESILVNHPDDLPTQKKLAEVREKLSENLGHENLLELVEKTQSEQKERIQQVENKLNLFLHKIEIRAIAKRV